MVLLAEISTVGGYLSTHINLLGLAYGSHLKIWDANLAYGSLLKPPEALLLHLVGPMSSQQASAVYSSAVARCTEL